MFFTQPVKSLSLSNVYQRNTDKKNTTNWINQEKMKKETASHWSYQVQQTVNCAGFNTSTFWYLWYLIWRQHFIRLLSFAFGSRFSFFILWCHITIEIIYFLPSWKQTKPLFSLSQRFFFFLWYKLFDEGFINILNFGQPFGHSEKFCMSISNKFWF